VLFNSYVFVLAFLPAALAVFHLLRRHGMDRTSIIALSLLSLLFYGWWDARYLLLLVPLMLANYALARVLIPREGGHVAGARWMLAAGVTANLAVLGYFKYANFFVDNVNAIAGWNINLAHVVLPLGISFFIFQKIAFLVDAYRGRVHHLDLPDYALFVSFFPQLIAGPIVHHSEVLPQFLRRGAVPRQLFAMGVTIFVIGLAKKVLLADNAALFASPRFDAVAQGTAIGFVDAWTGALAYTAQLYFDFSGYSDMAIGAGLMFGIRLPVNFASPYKATSIIDFWRRWHITLSRFLRDYLYIPLGGNQRGSHRRFANLFVTMLLGGLWHGAGWTFVVWGALHGAYLIVNHGWRSARQRVATLGRIADAYHALPARALTFLAVVVAWVFFRATDVDGALHMLLAMSGAQAFAGSGAAGTPLQAFPDTGPALATVAALLAVAWLAPSTQQLARYTGPEHEVVLDVHEAENAHAVRWQPRVRWALSTGAVFAVCLMSMTRISEFLYFQF
jgi:D-alanyl-lipoteichoic acid acyltransferase DltB (MBOAT superfamily)